MSAAAPEERWNPEVADELLAVGSERGGRAGHMFGHPALYAGRRLAACAYGDGIAFKLPRDRVSRALADRRARPFQPYGKPMMAQWLHIRVTTATGVRDVVDLVEESLAFARDT